MRDADTVHIEKSKMEKLAINMLLKAAWTSRASFSGFATTSYEKFLALFR
jgi:hypothetical protein